MCEILKDTTLTTATTNREESGDSQRSGLFPAATAGSENSGNNFLPGKSRRDFKDLSCNIWAFNFERRVDLMFPQSKNIFLIFKFKNIKICFN